MSKIYEALEEAERRRKATVQSIGFEKTPVVSKESIREKPAARSKSIAGLNTIAAEEFRKLRTLILQTSASKPMQTILVTSAVPGEGKSTIAGNLALVIARGIKEHALLIDCDLRNSHKNPLLKGNTHFGLSDYLMGTIDLTEVVMSTEAPKLSVLPSGSITSNSSELMGSEKMRNLMKTLKSQYTNRYIIIDSPPIMLTTEPIILSEMVDGVIVVVLAGKTPREIVQRAVSSMDKEKILGIVLNQMEAKHSSYYPKYYYHYYSEKEGARG